MKTDVHPTYYDNVAITCSCGNVIQAGSTKETLRTELCSACHPFYTGHKKLIDTAGRVDRFEARRKAAELHKQAVKEKKMSVAMKKTEVKEEKPAKKTAVKAAAKKTPVAKKAAKAKK